MKNRTGKALRILVADDDGNMLFMVSEILARQGYEVFQAINGDQALNPSVPLHK